MRQRADLGAEDGVEHQVAAALVIDVIALHSFDKEELAGKSDASCCRRGQSRVVGLQGANGDHRVRALSLGRGKEVLELAQLVAAAADFHVIVSFDEQLHAVRFGSEGCLQTRQPLYRRRSIHKWYTGKASKRILQFLNGQDGSD
jgi:hypothetical protein